MNSLIGAFFRQDLYGLTFYGHGWKVYASQPLRVFLVQSYDVMLPKTEYVVVCTAYKLTAK